MNIYILEDGILQQKRLEEIVYTFFNQREKTCKKIVVTSNPDTILNEIAPMSGNKSIYFLDIEIKNNEKKGLDVAKLIRKRDKQGHIVFVTTHFEFVPITFKYKVSALDFIDKGLSDGDFQQRVVECIKVVEKDSDNDINNDVFSFKNQHTSFQIPFPDILYFETTEVAHKIKLITRHRQITSYGDMKTIELMDARLIRTHRSFIVNQMNIVSIDKRKLEVELTNDQRVMVSRRLLKSTLEKIEI